MNKKYLQFLAVVLALAVIEGGFLLFMVKSTPIAKDPKFLVVMALVFLIAIPLNIYVAWKLILKGQQPE